ncbi:hypothetical protein [Lentibacillus sp. Marseille-P4043]|uniref:hypothetical protein n=1 Tax=Lentibacillus sp. Marseille-P4043 TaxID=2040293 RepID=UPI000D0BB7F3|nr:hypothetical protein [Lentibacillus sp. Marseille-P4043]
MKRIILVTSVIGLIVCFVLFIFNLKVSSIPFFKELLSATISMGAIAVGFLAAAITLMPTLQSNDFLADLKSIGGYEKLLNALLVAIAILFILCLISLTGFFFNINKVNTYTTLFLYVWMFFFVNSVSLVSYVVGVFLYYLKSTSSDK